jgi:endonuclease/exonuclease/phosphatase family metal-dependent hydrolase
MALTFALALGLPACDGDGSDEVTALSYNMYFGFDFAQAFSAPAAAFAQFQRTDLGARIRGMAEFLADEEPDLVGLQEVMSLVLTQGTQDPGDDTPIADFLSTLQTAIRNVNGPEYEVFVLQNITVPLTADLGTGPQDLLFRASNVILVHPDWTSQAVGQGRIFTTRAVFGPVTIDRGVHHVRATRDDLTIEVFNTHLESVSLQVATAQAAEVLDYIETQTGSSANTAILFGDMNATPTEAAYQALAAGGLIDTFADANGGAQGFTCCQAADLDNASSEASQRIDYVFVVPGTDPSEPEIVSSEVVLDERVARSTGADQIWPSDHFGVLTVLEF